MGILMRALGFLVLATSTGCTLVLSETPCDTVAPPGASDPSDTAVDSGPAGDTNDTGDTGAPLSRTAQALVAGGHHTCAVDLSGAVDCWGLDGESETTAAPAALIDPTHLSAGYRFTCALAGADPSTPTCWGDESSGQSSPTGNFLGPLAAGGAHACALAETGGVACWGRDIEGQTRPPEVVRASESLHLLASGWLFSCAQSTADSAPVCWGYDDSGQVSTVPAGPLDAMALGQGFGVGIDRTTGQSVCWGHSDICARVLSEGDEPWAQVVAGLDFACNRSETGQVTCWGTNANGVLTDVPATPFRSITAGPGGRHVCGILDDGTDQVTCWGLDASGQATP
ncbi:MAG: hypothetical protein CL927_02115 [Deltaproteobacteria bacterium]|nr:hypothetical protein [Deltaproteobacteria bacterium]HCH65563.1 hypothetical protein [Deltaproteobacteria bacterium]